MAWLISQALMKAYENSHCSQVPGVESLGENCLDGELSAPLNGNPTQLAYLSPVKTTESWSRFPSGMTCKPLTESRGQDVLTWFLEGFHVKTFQAQEKALESTEDDQECGEKWRVLSAKYDPHTHTLKTAQCSLLEDLTGLSATLPVWGMWDATGVYQQPIVALGMRETEFGYLLPTPNTKGLDGGSNSRRANKRRMMPTPKKQDMRHAISRHIEPTSKHWENNLGEVLVALTGLKKWSPTFVEWHMGWPIDHTALQPLEMDKYQSWLQQHGECLVVNDKTTSSPMNAGASSYK